MASEVPGQRREWMTSGIRIFGLAAMFVVVLIAADISVAAFRAGDLAVGLIGLVLFAATGLQTWLRLGAYREWRHAQADMRE